MYKSKVSFTPFLFLLLFLTSHISSTCYGQEWIPMNNGLYGGSVRTLFLKDNIIFAGTPESGIFRSDDAARTWKPANEGLLNKHITSFCSSGDSLFVGTFFEGIHLSLDNGETWTPIGTGLDSRQIYTLFLDGNIILAGTPKGIFKSTNHGKNWTNASNGLSTTNSSFLGLNKITKHGNVYYAASVFDGLFVTKDSGNNWAKVDFFSNLGGVSLVESYNNILFVGTLKGLFASFNDGEDFIRIDDGILENRFANDLIEFNNTLFVATSTGTFSSPVSTLALTKVPLEGVAQEFANVFLRVGDKLLLGLETDGVMQSADGHNWSRTSEGLTALIVTGMERKGNVLYASTGEEVYYSNNGGEEWAKLTKTRFDGRIVWEVRVKGDTLLGSRFGQIVFSIDNGTTWAYFPTAGMGSFAQLISVVNGRIYASTDEGLFVFHEGEERWRVILPTTSHEFFSKVLSSGNTLIALTFSSKIYASQDNGETWEVANTGLPSGFFVAPDGAIINGQFYIALDRGVYKSENAGLSWTRVNSEDYIIATLATSKGYLIAGTTQGVYFSPDEGNTWIEANGEKLDKLKIESSIISGNDLFVGSTEGIYKTSLDNFGHQIQSFSPTYGLTGARVTLTGRNFSSLSSYLSVTINGVEAPIVQSSSNRIVFDIPEGASSGKINVRLNGRTVESGDVFCIGSDPTIQASQTASEEMLLVSSWTHGNQWFFNDEKIEGANGQSIAVKDAGLYKVVVTSGSCTFAGTYELVITDTETVKEASSIRVYPVPTTNNITIDLSTVQRKSNVLLKLFNSTGIQVYHKIIEANAAHSISLEQYVSGIYTLQAIQEDRVETVRVVKE